jgi:amidase
MPMDLIRTDTILPAFDVTALQLQLQQGRLTAALLTQACLTRIDSIDRSGRHECRAVIELNPDAMAIAEDLDRERQAGKVRRPLHRDTDPD